MRKEIRTRKVVEGQIPGEREREIFFSENWHHSISSLLKRRKLFMQSRLVIYRTLNSKISRANY